MQGGPTLKGACKAIYCLDVAQGIQLGIAGERLSASRRAAFQRKSRLPSGGSLPPPLRIGWTAAELGVGGRRTAATVEVALHEVGAISITWDVPFEGELEPLVELATCLYGNVELEQGSRAVADEVLSALGPAVDRPLAAGLLEDYVVFQMRLVGGPTALLAGDAGATLARILRAEPSELSRQQVEDALASPMSYGPHDLCLVDWIASFLLGEDTEDERLVLELANVALLELRTLDAQLDQAISEAYSLLAAGGRALGSLGGGRAKLEHIARMQADDALLHEGIDNAHEIFGDDYLARVHARAAERFHFDSWDAAIERKLGVLRSVYQSLVDLASHRRSEALEWTIIVLIAVEIVLYVVPYGPR